MSKSIKQFISEIENSIEKDQLSNEEIDNLNNMLYENQKISLEGINKYYLINLTIIVSHILIQNEILDSLNVFEFNIANKNFISLTIPICSSFLNFIILSHLTNYIIIDETVRNLQIKRYPKIHKNLRELLFIPTFFESLNFRHKLNGSFISELKLVIVTIIIGLSPFIYLIYTQIKLFLEYYNKIEVLLILFSIYMSYKSLEIFYKLIKSSL
ncbi:hypothetical protein ACK1KB_12620 [Chryseobacterium sp. TY3]